MTSRAWLRLALVVLVTLVLQEGVLNGITIGGAHPDAFVVLAVAAGLAAGAQRGAVIAFAIGLVADLFVLTPFGLSSLVFVLVAFCVGLLAAVPSGRAPAGFQMLVALVAGLLGSVVFDGLNDLLGQPKLPNHQLVVVTVVVGLAAALLVVPARAAMSWALTVGPARETAALTGGSATR